MPVWSPVLTLMDVCDMDLVGVDNCPQIRCNVKHSDLKELCANKPVQQIICTLSCTPLVWF